MVTVGEDDLLLPGDAAERAGMTVEAYHPTTESARRAARIILSRNRIQQLNFPAVCLAPEFSTLNPHMPTIHRDTGRVRSRQDNDNHNQNLEHRALSVISR